MGTEFKFSRFTTSLRDLSLRIIKGENEKFSGVFIETNFPIESLTKIDII